MEQVIAGMLEEYETGRLSRRQLVRQLALLAGGAQLSRAEEAPFKAAGLNHIAIRVTDIPRSRDFYRKLLGLPLIREAETSCFLGIGKHFLTLFRNSNPGLDHYCVAVEAFNANSAMDRLAHEGLRPRRPPGTDRVYFPDPDGIEVQLSAIDHTA